MIHNIYNKHGGGERMYGRWFDWVRGVMFADMVWVRSGGLFLSFQTRAKMTQMMHNGRLLTAMRCNRTESGSHKSGRKAPAWLHRRPALEQSPLSHLSSQCCYPQQRKLGS